MHKKQKKLILIVDDDITSLDIVAVLFEKNGFEVKRTTCGEDAIKSYQDSKPDIILLDLMMPRTNGIQTMYGLSKIGLDIPVIAFTASNDPVLHQQAKEAGCNSIICKPCRSKILLEIVNETIESSIIGSEDINKREDVVV